MLSNFIKRNLPSPEMVEQEKKSVIRTLQTIVVVSMVGTVVSFLAASFLPATAQASVVMAGLFLLLAVSLFLLRRGILLPAQLLTPTALFATVTYLVIYGNGLHDAAFLGFAGVIIVASLTLGQGAAFVFAGMIIITSWTIGFAELNGSLVSPGSGLTDESTPVYITILVLAITFTQRTLINRMNENLQRAHESEALAKRELAERKQTEEALRESGERLQLFFNQSLAGFFFSMIDNPIEWNDSIDKEKALDYILDHQRITEANDAMVEQYGATREGFLGRSVRDFFAHNLVEARQFRKKLFDQGRLHINTDERKDDGTPMLIGGDYVCLYDKQGSITGMFGIQRDITERKRAEEALREAEIKYRTLMEQLPAMTYIYQSGDINQMTYISPQVETLLGYSQDEWLADGDLWVKSLHPGDRDRVVAELRQMAYSGDPLDTEYRVLTRDDRLRWFHNQATMVRGPDGKVQYVHGVVFDITESKRAEQEIRENEQRYRALFEQSNDAIFIMSLDRRILAINQHAVRLLGYSEEETIGKDTLNSLHMPPTEIDDARRKFEQIVAGEKLPIYERAFIRKDGSTLMTEINLSLIHDMAGQPGLVQSIVRDITERKHAEEELQRARQRLVTAVEEERRRLRRDLHDGLGPALASQGLKLAAAKQLLNHDPASAEPLLDQVMAQIQETVGDVRHLVYSLRPPALDERGLAEAIRDHVLHGELGSLHVEVSELPSGLPPLPAAVEVAAYRIALEALTNVIRHARAKHCTIQFALNGNRRTNLLQIEVVDDGTGLPRKLRAGVGLRSMRERAEELGGTLTVEPMSRGGTRVIAMLPLGNNTNSRDFDHIASADY